MLQRHYSIASTNKRTCCF